MMICLINCPLLFLFFSIMLYIPRYGARQFRESLRMIHIHFVKHWMVLRRHVLVFVSTRLNGLKRPVCFWQIYEYWIYALSRVYKNSTPSIEKVIEGNDRIPCIAVHDVRFNKFQGSQSRRRLTIVRSSCYSYMTQNPKRVSCLNAARYCLYSKWALETSIFIYHYTFSFVSLFFFLRSTELLIFFIDYCSTETFGHTNSDQCPPRWVVRASWETFRLQLILYF